MTKQNSVPYFRLKLNEIFKNWTDVAGVLALTVAVGLGFLDHDLGDFRLWLSVVLAALYLFLTWGIEFVETLWLSNLKIGLLMLIPLTLILVGINGFTAVLMFFVLSATVMYTLPERNGYIWLGILGLIIILVYITVWADHGNVLTSIGTVAGILFVGSAASSQVKAIEAEIESRRLLNELEHAHQQLQNQAAQAEELAITNERNRLAREVHDTLGHKLTVAAVQLEGAQKLINSDPNRAEEMVATVREQVLLGLSELRKTVSTLRAPVEEELSLSNALPRLVRNFEDATSIKTTLTIAAEVPPLPSDYRHTLYRSAQELLTNIQKHAQADQAWLALSVVDAEFVLTIEDNGRGFSEMTEQSGFGLQGIRERVTHLGGEVKINKRAGGGTLVNASLPVNIDTEANRE